MCVSTPDYSAATQSVTAPTRIVEMDTSDSVAAQRQSDIRRRQRALTRAGTLGNSLEGTAGTGKTQLGA